MSEKRYSNMKCAIPSSKYLESLPLARHVLAFGIGNMLKFINIIFAMLKNIPLSLV